MSWFKTFDSNKEHRKMKNQFRKEIVEKADLHKHVLKITMTTQE